MQCLKTYTGQLYKAVKEHKTLMNFDGLLYIAGTTPILVVTFGLILINCIMYVSKAMTTWLFIVNIIIPNIYSIICNGIREETNKTYDKRTIMLSGIYGNMGNNKFKMLI